MRHATARPYDGGGTNLNPRPIGRNPEPRTIGHTRPRQANRATFQNPRVIGETCKATEAGRLLALYSR